MRAIGGRGMWEQSVEITSAETLCDVDDDV
jgi:hypothetical protein